MQFKRWVTADERPGSLLGSAAARGPGDGGADIVLGLDMNLAAQARALGVLRAPTASRPATSTCRSPGRTTPSCPSTGGYLAFVYDETRLARRQRASRRSSPIRTGRGWCSRIRAQARRASGCCSGRAPRSAIVWGMPGPRWTPADRHLHHRLVGGLRAVPRRRGRHGALLLRPRRPITARSRTRRGTRDRVVLGGPLSPRSRSAGATSRLRRARARPRTSSPSCSPRSYRA